jgi:hypothetical protein
VSKNRKELPGSLDFEEVEGGGFGFGQFVLDDGVDAAAARAFVEFGAELCEGFGVASGEEFDFAVVGVADPSAQAERGGLAMDEPAKADALHTSADKKVKNHMELSVSQRDGEVSNKTAYAIKAGSGPKDNSG